jgi:hypothetical protein
VDRLFQDIILPTLGAIIAVYIPFFVHKAVAFLNKYLNMNIDQKKEDEIDQVIENAIYAVEEKAAYECKHNLKEWGPVEKNDWALSFILRFVDNVDQKKLEDLLLAKLGQPWIKAGATYNAEKKIQGLDTGST